MTTSLAAALSALELGHLEPRAEDVSGMCPPSTEALEQTTTAIWSDLFATLQNTSLERDIEEMGWGLVNLFHRAAAKKHATIDRLTDEIRLLLAEQDGSEINTANLEDKIDPYQEDRGGRHLLRTHARHRSGSLYPRDRPFLDPVDRQPHFARGYVGNR